jgi:hypothetical protein
MAENTRKSSEGKSCPVIVSIDTIELLFSMDRATADRIRPEFEELHVIDKLEPVKNKANEKIIIGHRFCFNGPWARTALSKLEPLRKKYRGTIHRFDIAYDGCPEHFKYCLHHAVLLWREPGAMKDFENDDGTQGHIWAKKNSSRNLELYQRTCKSAMTRNTRLPASNSDS